VIWLLAAVALAALVVGYLKGCADGEAFGRGQRIRIACELNDAREREKAKDRRIASLERGLVAQLDQDEAA
jgi:hypothetical protein